MCIFTHKRNYFIFEEVVQMMASPADSTDQNSRVASKWFTMYLIKSKLCFHNGLTFTLAATGSKFLAFRKSIKNGESFVTAGKYSVSFSLVHQGPWFLQIKIRYTAVTMFKQKNVIIQRWRWHFLPVLYSSVLIFIQQGSQVFWRRLVIWRISKIDERQHFLSVGQNPMNEW